MEIPEDFFANNSASEDENSLTDDEQNSEDANSDDAQENDEEEDNLDNSNKRKSEWNDENESKKSKKLELSRQPTAEELVNLQQTENLFKSHLSKLQIEELLKELNIKQKHKKLFNTWFEQLKEILAKMPEHKELILSDKDDHLRADYKGTIKFVKPEHCSAFNMHKIFCLNELELIVDVNIAMPKTCFLEKDYLNNRYAAKCKKYLRFIYKKIQKAGLVGTAYFPSSLNAVVQINPSVSNKIKINLHVTPAEDTFKLIRFEPDKSNLRNNLFDTFKDLNPVQIKDNATPYYNYVLLHELTLASNYKNIEDSVKDMENVHDAIKLLQLWQQQRGLHLNGFSNYILKNIIVYLINKRNVNRLMSSYQVIRNFWVFLSKTNWHENSISLCENVDKQKLNLFRDNFDVVFLDQSGSCNLAAFLNLEVYMKVRREAELAVEFLDDGQVDSFLALFRTRLDAPAQYDALLRFTNIQYINVYNTIKDTVKYKYVGCLQTLIITQILQVLRRGLSNRVFNIVPLRYNETENTTLPKNIIFGITLNPEYAFNTLEKGPLANSTEALEFRTFWEDLSECRRFVDGSICEAVYFAKQTFHDKRKIFKEIIDFVVMKKLKLDNYEIICDTFEDMLILENYVTPFPTGTCEESTQKVISIFDGLSKILRGFKLPLEVTGIQGASEMFSYTCVYPPIPTNYKFGGKLTSYQGDSIILKEKLKTTPKYIEAIECVIHLASSSKWPNDLEAIHQLKLGFYLQISKLLKREHDIISTIRTDCLDVCYQGLVFRLRLYQPKEVSVLKRSKTANGLTVYEDTLKSIEIEKTLHILPRIIGALNGIQAQNHSFGASTTLIKRWIRSHLIDDYNFPDIVISLINAYLYLKPAPYNNSNLPQVAFLRFLQFIADFDSELQFIVVNFNNEVTKESLAEIDEEFQKNRQKYPPLFIVTPFESGLFSKKCTNEILSRISLLAKATYDYITAPFLEKNYSSSDAAPNSFVDKLFVPNLEGFNLLINIKALMNPKRHEQFDFLGKKECRLTIKEYDETQDIKKMPVVAFDPVHKYLQELRKNYDGIALFFHDTYGGNVIGVLWNPSASEQGEEFKISHVNGRKLEKNKLYLNKEAIIEDFYIIGSGIVKAIEEKN